MTGNLSGGRNELQLDDMHSLDPFVGWTNESLNVAFSASAMGDLPVMGVSFWSHQTHFLSLPVDVSRMADLCLGSLAFAASALGGAGVSDCNATEIGATLGEVLAVEERSALAERLTISLAWSVVSSPLCQVSLDSSVSASGITGPEGPFTLRVEQAATLQLPAPSAT